MTAAQPKNETQMEKLMFQSLVSMLGASAMQQLGKLVNPVSGKTETDLDAAQITIDMLAMLKNKTQGNLDRDEDKLLADLLAALQMNFVETAASAQSSPNASSPHPDTAPEQPGPSPTPETKDAHDPKYHKSYGA